MPIGGLRDALRTTLARNVYVTRTTTILSAKCHFLPYSDLEFLHLRATLAGSASLMTKFDAVKTTGLAELQPQALLRLIPLLIHEWKLVRP